MFDLRRQSPQAAENSAYTVIQTNLTSQPIAYNMDYSGADVFHQMSALYLM